jgi:hypothetical protein
MAIRNLFDQANNQYVFPTIDASVLEIDNVPISTGGMGTQNLQQVLNTGADGGNQSITDLNSVNVNGYLNLNSASLGQLHFNNGSNSWQILTNSNNELLIQNYANNALLSQSFMIDNDGNVLLGNTSSTTPFIYVMGGNGPGRVYDTIYNPLPSNPSGLNAVIYNQNYLIPTLNLNSAIVNNSNLSKNFVVLKQLTTNNYPNCSHYVLNINSIVCMLSNQAPSNFSLDFALISNRGGVLTAITQSDLNKTFVIPRYQNTNYVDATNFTISDIQIEFYDNSGINNMMLVCFSNGISITNVFNISSINLNVRADNIGVYNDLANITS